MTCTQLEYKRKRVDCGEGMVHASNDRIPVPLSREVIGRSTVLQHMLSDAQDESVTSDLPSGVICAWLEGLEILGVTCGTQPSKLARPSLCRSTPLERIQAADFLDDQAALTSLCKIASQELFAPLLLHRLENVDHTLAQDMCELPSNLQQAVLAEARVPLLLQLKLLPPALHEAALHAAYPSIATACSLTLPCTWDCSDRNSIFWELLQNETKLHSLQFCDHSLELCRQKLQSLQFCDHSLELCRQNQAFRSMLNCVAKLTNLQFVSVAGLNLGGQCIAELVSLLCPSSLKHLNVSNNRVHERCHVLQLAQSFSQLTQLQSLDISRNDLGAICGPSAADALGQAISQLRDLHSLNVTACMLHRHTLSVLTTHLSKCAHLRELRFCENAVNAAFVCSLQSLCLEHFELGSYKIICGGMDASMDGEGLAPHIANMTALQELRVKCDEYDDAFLVSLAEHLTELSRLQTLHLDLNEVSGTGASAVANIVSRLPALQVLNVNLDNYSGCRFEDDGHVQFSLASAVAGATQLQQMCLRNLRLDGMGTLLSRAEEFTRLQTLNLKDSMPSQDSFLAPSLSKLSKLSALKHLSLEYSIHDAEAGTVADQIGELSALQTVCLKITKILPTDVGVLASQMGKLKCLRELDLECCKFGGVGGAHIAPLFEPLTALRKLSLSTAHLGDMGVSVLAVPIGKLPALEYLDLSYNNLSCDGIEGFACHITKVTTLQHLDLSDNRISDRGFWQLAHCMRVLPLLQWLNLRDNEIVNMKALDLCPYVAMRVPTCFAMRFPTCYDEGEENRHECKLLSDCSLKVAENFILDLSNSRSFPPVLALVGYGR